MSRALRLPGIALGMLLTALCTSQPTSAAAPPPRGEVTQALGMIRKALEAGPGKGDSATQLRTYRVTLTGILPLVAVNVEATETLGTARTRPERSKDDREAAKVLRTALAEVRDTLAFEPLMEAERPAGFPRPTPVGEIRLNVYPAYRLARTPMKGKEGAAFWTLLGHIKKDNVAMTAPVEMTYGGKPGESAGPTAMAFLYGSTDLGKPGKDGGVEVADVPAASAASIGVRGDTTEARVAEARKRLASWLEAHPKYVSAGPVRVMGYNSPFVSSLRRYWEVQVPVRKAGKARD